MNVLPILAVGIFMKLVAVLFVLCAVVLILIILIQKGKGGGLSGALAGGVASGLLGSKTGDFLTWVTIGVVGVFLFLAVLLAKFYRPSVMEIGAPPDAQTQPASGSTGQTQPAANEPPTAGTAQPSASEPAAGTAQPSSGEVSQPQPSAPQPAAPQPVAPQPATGKPAADANTPRR